MAVKACVVLICLFVWAATAPLAAAATPPPTLAGSVAVTWDGLNETVVRYDNQFAASGASTELTFAGSPGSLPDGATTDPEASQSQELGSVSPMIVFDGDNTTRINPTTSFPYRTVVRIEYPGGGWCSGWMNGPRHVTTAAHCLYENGVWKEPSRIVPAKNGSTEPYGYCGWRLLVVPQEWIWWEDAQWKYDYAVIGLTCSIGNQIGYVSYGVRSNQVNVQVRIDGYPGGSSGKPIGTMWQSPGKITDESSDIWHYDADTWPGLSGAWIRRAVDNVVIGINSHDSVILNFNAGVRINLTVYNNLTTWRTW